MLLILRCCSKEWRSCALISGSLTASFSLWCLATISPVIFGDAVDNKICESSIQNAPHTLPPYSYGFPAIHHGIQQLPYSRYFNRFSPRHNLVYEKNLLAAFRIAWSPSSPDSRKYFGLRLKCTVDCTYTMEI